MKISKFVQIWKKISKFVYKNPNIDFFHTENHLQIKKNWEVVFIFKNFITQFLCVLKIFYKNNIEFLIFLKIILEIILEKVLIFLEKVLNFFIITMISIK